MTEQILNHESSEELTIPNVLPLLALRDVVAYPHMQIALLSWSKSIKAVDAARSSDNLVFVVAQKTLLPKKLIRKTCINTELLRKLCKWLITKDENCIKVL